MDAGSAARLKYISLNPKTGPQLSLCLGFWSRETSPRTGPHWSVERGSTPSGNTCIYDLLCRVHLSEPTRAGSWKVGFQSFDLGRQSCCHSRLPSVAQTLGPALMGPPFPLASALRVQKRVGPIPVGSSGSVSPEQHFLLRSLA